LNDAGDSVLSLGIIGKIFKRGETREKPIVEQKRKIQMTLLEIEKNGQK